MFDQPFAVGGTWHDGQVATGAATGGDGTSYDDGGRPPVGRGGGGWISFDPAKAPGVTMLVGIS